MDKSLLLCQCFLSQQEQFKAWGFFSRAAVNFVSVLSKTKVVLHHPGSYWSIVSRSYSMQIWRLSFETNPWICTKDLSCSGWVSSQTLKVYLYRSSVYCLARRWLCLAVPKGHQHFWSSLGEVCLKLVVLCICFTNFKIPVRESLNRRKFWAELQ